MDQTLDHPTPPGLRPQERPPLYCRGARGCGCGAVIGYLAVVAGETAVSGAIVTSGRGCLKIHCPRCGRIRAFTSVPY